MPSQVVIDDDDQACVKLDAPLSNGNSKEAKGINWFSELLKGRICW